MANECVGLSVYRSKGSNVFFSIKIRAREKHQDEGRMHQLPYPIRFLHRQRSTLRKVGRQPLVDEKVPEGPPNGAAQDESNQQTKASF